MKFGLPSVHFIMLLYLLASSAVADDNNRNKPVMLQSFEPNLVGWRYDSNDVNYIEFKISLKYPLLHDGTFHQDANPYLPKAYFAFTGVWGQYFGTRHSSPVIAKRYNPEFWGRWWLDGGDDYIDASLGHESNGQSIDSYKLFKEQQQQELASGDRVEFANDYISRGWDYLGVRYKNDHFLGRNSLTLYANFRYFLSNGPFQGSKEEYQPWLDDPSCAGEPKTWNTECKRLFDKYQRSYYDGVELIFKKHFSYQSAWLSSNKFAVLYQTGYKKPLKHNTLRFEFTSTFFGKLPIMLWAQTGYNSDLVHYYEKVDSAGIALELQSFLQ